MQMPSKVIVTIMQHRFTLKRLTHLFGEKFHAQGTSSKNVTKARRKEYTVLICCLQTQTRPQWVMQMKVAERCAS